METNRCWLFKKPYFYYAKSFTPIQTREIPNTILNFHE